MNTIKRRRFWGFLLALVLVVSCVMIPVEATELPKDDIIIPRVSGQLRYSVPANSLYTVGDWISLEKGETVGYNCTYTPSSTSVDFGLIDVNGQFYYINCTNGSINKSIEITSRGQYILAIRNNSSSEITVTGTVRY